MNRRLALSRIGASERRASQSDLSVSLVLNSSESVSKGERHAFKSLANLVNYGEVLLVMISEQKGGKKIA